MIPVFGRVLGENVFGMIGLSEQFVEVWFIIRWILTALILIVVLTILFFIGPNKKLKLVHTLPGATVATIGWMLTSWGFSYYVSNFGNYSATYGSLGGIIVLWYGYFYRHDDYYGVRSTQFLIEIIAACFQEKTDSE